MNLISDRRFRSNRLLGRFRNAVDCNWYDAVISGCELTCKSQTNNSNATPCSNASTPRHSERGGDCSSNRSLAEPRAYVFHIVNHWSDWAASFTGRYGGRCRRCRLGRDNDGGGGGRTRVDLETTIPLRSRPLIYNVAIEVSAALCILMQSGRLSNPGISSPRFLNCNAHLRARSNNFEASI